VYPGYIPFLVHNPTRDFDFIRRSRCSALKLYLYLADNETWKKINEIAPQAYLLAVDVARSDSTDLSNPRGDAEAGCHELDLRPAAKRRLMGKNEMLKQKDTAEQVKRWVDYHVRFTQRCHELGTAVAVGAVNTGHPALLLFGDELDQWPLVKAVDDELAGDDCWDLHEYWTADGPLACWPFTAGRHLRCPTQHDILIGEYGYDFAVWAPDGTPNHGWGGKLPAETYVNHIIQYHRCITDPRVVGTCGFLLDFADKHWESWDLSGLMESIISCLDECNTPLPEVVMPTRLHLPVSTYGYISQTFAQHVANNSKGGWGLDFSCLMRTAVLAAADGVVDKVLDYGAESYGKMVQINHWWGFTRYAHLDTLPLKKGDGVDAGEPIAFSGSTGHSTGPHLHFEVVPFSNRAPNPRVDPAPLLGLGGDVVPVPTPTPTPSPSPVTPEELAVARTRFTDGAIGFLDKIATKKGLDSFGYEWDRGGYKFLLAGKPGTSEIVVLKCPSGRYEEALVTFGAL
jgi:hypothetical protein